MPGKHAAKRRRAAASSIALACAAGISASAVALAQGFEVPFAANQYILDQTNAYRKSKGAKKLGAHHPPNVAADEYARFLAKNNLFGHTADGRQPSDRVKAAGGKFCGVWENVHESSSWPDKASWRDAMDQAMDFWEHSPGHEASLRRAEADQIGIGVHGWKHGDKWSYKEVQVFLQTKS